MVRWKEGCGKKFCVGSGRCGFSEEAYDKAALLFEKRRASVVRIVAKLNRILDKLKEGK